MTRYFAFLRALNVGGSHVVRMSKLVELFEAMGHREVSTYIASGNVCFGARSKDAAKLERAIEKGLEAALGWEVATFLRTEAELIAVAAASPHPAAEVAAAKLWNVIFVREKLDAAAKKRVAALESKVDRLRVTGREIHWLCRSRQAGSGFSNRDLEKAVQGPFTVRGIRTIREMAMRYTGGAS